MFILVVFFHSCQVVSVQIIGPDRFCYNPFAENQEPGAIGVVVQMIGLECLCFGFWSPCYCTSCHSWAFFHV